MKKVIPVFMLFLVIVFSGCREKELKDVNVLEGPLSCYNGVFDKGEKGTDCGSKCVPCASQSLFCDEALLNTFVTQRSGSFEAKVEEVTSVTVDSTSSDYIITAKSKSNSFQLKFKSRPNLAYRYSIASVANTSSVELQIVNEYGSYSQSGSDGAGSIAINYDEGSDVYVFSICDSKSAHSINWSYTSVNNSCSFSVKL